MADYMKNIVMEILKKVFRIDINDIQLQNKVLSDKTKQLLEKNAASENKENILIKKNAVLQNEKKRLLDELNSNINESQQLQERVSSLELELTLTIEKVNSLELQSQNHIIEIGKKDNTIKELQANTQVLESVDEDNEKISDGQIQDQIDSLKMQYQNLKEQYYSIDKEYKDYKAKNCTKDATIDILNKEKVELQNEIYRLGKLVPTIEEDNEEVVPETASGPNETDSGEQKIIVGEGSMITIGPIKNTDSGYVDKTKRAIDTVIDTDTSLEISARDFFAQPENAIFKVRTEVQKSIYLRKPKFVCKYCHQAVKISGRKTERGKARFFSHLRDSDECDYKTTTGRARWDINREKYARCNEGERHKKLKTKIAELLEITPGVSDVKVENTVIGNHPILNWKRPDILASFRGQEIVFELQLSTTFVSVIAERDLFYRLNEKFIIWVSNFDEQDEHVNLDNMMIKDIYYNNKMNVFIFDREAQKKSEERGELILKCNWLKADGSWEYLNKNSSNGLGGMFVCLSDLQYDSTYKPYYFDAEQRYFEAHPEFKLETLNIERENKRILEELDELWRQEQEDLKTEDKLERLQEAFELDAIMKSTQKYVIGKKDEKCGLITFDGEIKIAFEYESIRSRRGWWYEGKKDGLYDLFDKNNYTLLNTGIRLIEEFNPIGAKYVKEVDGALLWGIMNRKGIPLTSTCYSQLEMWSSDKIIAMRNGLYCIVDFQGNEVLSNYDYIGELNADNIANVKCDGCNGFIDSNCKILKKKSRRLDNGMEKFLQMDKWGIEREDGSIVIPSKYDEIGSYKDGLVGINDVSFSIVDEKIGADCPVKVEYISRNERQMLIFKLGKREAFMNLRQQNKARNLGLQPQNMKELYFSFVNIERSLLYLSAVPVRGEKQQIKIEDKDIPFGTIYTGRFLYKKKNYVIIHALNGENIFLRSSILGKYTVEELEKSKSITLKKIGYDQFYKKHIWEIISILS